MESGGRSGSLPEVRQEDETSNFIGSPANFIFLDTSDIRFQFLPENTEPEKVCEFLVENLTPLAISDVVLNGEFEVRNHRLQHAEENEILLRAAATRKRLYTVGKYAELKKRSEERKDIEQLDLRSRDEYEIKLFSDSQAAGGGTRIESPDEVETFRIKSKLSIFKKGASRSQKNLFDEPEITQLQQTAEYKESPEFNLLYSELEETRQIEQELLQARITEAELLRRSAQRKAAATPPAEEGKKIELPKDVKLKFGDES